MVPLLSDVADSDRVDTILSAWCVSTVFHVAAYNHVPLVEHNVLGTVNMARQAQTHGVDQFVLISTDKAVRPTNVMGATKRLAELCLQALANEPGNTTFSMVRFGNVLGSPGPVFPRFREQIRLGGPITLAHTEMTRFFMTILEAAQLVIQAGAMARGGEVFVLDMDQPVKIATLARRMVELSGLSVLDDQTPDGDIEIVTTGLRPGEELYEELLIGNSSETTQHPKIMKATEAFVTMGQFEENLNSLRSALSVNDIDLAKQLLNVAVPEHVPDDMTVDWVHGRQRRGG